jgi:hypothetical protein
MTCTRLTLPGGVSAIVCSSRTRTKLCSCGAPSTRLCDGPPPAGARRTTCSAPICDAHATATGEELDLCPACAAPDETGEVVGLAVFTARISSQDPDRFDITRKSGGPGGTIFAPSWAILKPALEARATAVAMLAEAKRQPEHRTFHEGLALAVEAEAWAVYVPAYRLEMLASWRAHRTAWEALLARTRVVLVCYCTSERCHRRLLAGYLVKLGAVDGGEIVEAPKQGALFAAEPHR